MPSPQASPGPASEPAFVAPGCIPLPPRAPVPLSHVHILSNPTILLCSREDLLFLLTALSPSHPGPAHCGPTPPVASTTTDSDTSQSPSETVPEDTDDMMSEEGASSETSLSSLESLGNKVPKPDGEPGRPGRGGYNLEAQLAWNSTAFSTLKNFVYRSIKKHLDTTQSISRQSRGAIRLVIREASDAFPDLECYFSCWPVRDLIQMRLKYTSQRARLFQRRAARNMDEEINS